MNGYLFDLRLNSSPKVVNKIICHVEIELITEYQIKDCSVIQTNNVAGAASNYILKPCLSSLPA